MITRCGVPPAFAHDPALPPPLFAIHPAHRAQFTPRRVAGGAVTLAILPAPGGPAGQPRLASRGGLVGGAVVLTGLPSTPGGSSGYGYLGMDITDAASWPRPFRPATGMIEFLNYPGGMPPQ